MLRRLRDLTATLVVLASLFAMLMLINPRLRERVVLMTNEVQNRGWESTGSPVGHVALSALAVTTGYAADNPYLFSFAVVAAVLFLLMLRT